ncbi:sulfate adenylyltransferase [Sulfurospirillum sp. 1612]|uniref:sulfate adenylyltransferase n=1 Tax=Sulfurospirillum sp. 1612 TaxID=3094835 RepID=UPI002F922FE4
MESTKKYRQIELDRQALATLSYAQEGIFKPVDRLMNQEEAIDVDNTGFYKGRPFPFPFILAPAGIENEKVISSVKPNERIDIVVDGEIRGYIIAQGFFEVDRKRRIEQIFGNYDINNEATIEYLQRLGKYSIYGDYQVDFDDIKAVKECIKTKIAETGAKSVAAIMAKANPFHRAHERLFRITLERSDLLVVFLSKPSEDGLLSYDLRYRSLKYFTDNYLPKNRVLIVPFESTYLFAGFNDAILDCICANNFGCNKFIIGQHHTGIGMYYDKNEIKSILSKYESLDIEIEVVSRYVYCRECKTLVNTNTCPHGSHQHIKYNAKALLKFFETGLLPPAMLMRTNLSSMILSEIMPNRFENLSTLYDDVFPNEGLLENHTEEEFYRNLLKLHQTTSLT